MGDKRKSSASLRHTPHAVAVPVAQRGERDPGAQIGETPQDLLRADHRDVHEEHVHGARAAAAVVGAGRADGEVRDAVAVDVAERDDRAPEAIVPVDLSTEIRVRLESADDSTADEPIASWGLKLLEEAPFRIDVTLSDFKSDLRPKVEAAKVSPCSPARTTELIDDIKGQSAAKRALAIAALGRHHLLLSGPPGSGKTMLAKRLIGLLEPLNREQVIELNCIASLQGTNHFRLNLPRPFREVHHSTSAAALIGGGNPPKPGEITNTLIRVRTQ